MSDAECVQARSVEVGGAFEQATTRGVNLLKGCGDEQYASYPWGYRQAAPNVLDHTLKAGTQYTVSIECAESNPAFYYYKESDGSFAYVNVVSVDAETGRRYARFTPTEDTCKVYFYVASKNYRVADAMVCDGTQIGSPMPWCAMAPR